MFNQAIFRKIIICALILTGKFTTAFAYELNFDYGLSSFFVLNKDAPRLYNSIDPGISISTNTNKQKTQGFFVSCSYIIPISTKDLKQKKSLDMHVPGGVFLFSGIQLEKQKSKYLTSSAKLGLEFRWLHYEIESDKHTAVYTENVSYGLGLSYAFKVITDNIFFKAGVRAEYYPITLETDGSNYFKSFAVTPTLSVGNYF